MALLRRIVVPIDFSQTSDEALQVALGYALETGAELSLVHVVGPAETAETGAFFRTPDVERATRDRATAALIERCGHLKSAGARHRSTVVTGSARDAIVCHAAAEHADLVVMGTHGRTGFISAAMGSVAQEVVAHAPCPVLLVRLGVSRSATHTGGRPDTDPTPSGR